MMSNQYIDVSFGEDPADELLRGLQPGEHLSAARFLTAVEGEDEDTVEALLEQLWEQDHLLDVSDLPLFAAAGDLAQRLRTEAELAKKGNWMEDLEESDPLRLYLEELAAIPAFGDLQIFADDLKADNQQGRNDPQLQNAIMNLCFSRVAQIAGDYTNRGVLLLDLMQDGSMGLWTGLSRYSGGDFEAFRDRQIHFAMAKTVVLQARENGVGQKLRQAAEDYRAVDEQLLGELGRNPTMEEMAERLHMSVEEAEVVADMLENARTVSRAKQIDQPQEETPEDEMAVEDTAYFQMRQRIADLLSGLSEADAKLISLRYGLEGGLPLSAEETARKLGITPGEVNAREAAALMKLREG